MIRILLIDNYDSFTYNLALQIKTITGCRPTVLRNDKVDLNEIDNYDKILLSPGPGIPADAGLMPAIIKQYAPHKSILGVCLGHQGIAECFGARLANVKPVSHGVATPVYRLNEDILFDQLPAAFEVGRYHSWIVDNEALPAELVVTVQDASGQIMALRHRHYDVRGIQFHPESVLTAQGKKIMENWIHH